MTLSQAALAVVLFMVPLAHPADWTDWDYRGRPAHAITRSAPGLEVRVDRSAGGLAYRLPEPMLVSRVRAVGRIEGQLSVTGAAQGLEGSDDYALRVGLVVAGDQRLNFFQRRFAPEWVKTLHGLAPSGTGIGEVRFFTVGVPTATVGAARRHPLHDLLHETVAAVTAPDGSFVLDAALEAPVETIAVWLSTDGDDTGSTFTLRLTSLTLDTVRK